MLWILIWNIARWSDVTGKLCGYVWKKLGKLLLKIIRREKMSEYIFRATPSIITAWQNGWRDDVVRSYFKLEEFTSPAMQEGKDWHKKWEESVNESGLWPIEFDPNGEMEALQSAKTEQKLKTRLLDWLDLVGVIDVHSMNAGGLIIDWKTGKTEAKQHIKTVQTGAYALLCLANNMPVQKLCIAHYDQKKKKADTAYRWVTKSLVANAFETIETVSSEIHSWFLAEDFYGQYNHIREAHYNNRKE
jgi:hypothetical protein